MIVNFLAGFQDEYFKMKIEAMIRGEGCCRVRNLKFKKMIANISKTIQDVLWRLKGDLETFQSFRREFWTFELFLKIVLGR